MRRSLIAALPLALVLASGCWRRTELAATWHEPSPTLLNFNRTVAVFFTTDESMRRATEDQLAAVFPNTIPSYRVLPNVANIDKGTILQQLRKAGFDGAITMRVTNVSEQINYNAAYNGPYWGGAYGFAGYWDNGWAYPYNPYYITTTQVVSVETNIYSLAKDKLVFAALSQTSDPANVGKLVRSVMRHVNEQLRKDGMIVSRPVAPRDTVAEVAAP
ncbi:MAG TPA: hypothetical protein VF461_00465 [Gemmatimonadaceae bacterium]